MTINVFHKKQLMVERLQMWLQVTCFYQNLNAWSLTLKSPNNIGFSDCSAFSWTNWGTSREGDPGLVKSLNMTMKLIKFYRQLFFTNSFYFDTIFLMRACLDVCALRMLSLE